MSESRMTGACLCGAVAYEFSGEPIMLYACHCADCQTATGSAFVLALRVPAGTIRPTRGQPKPYVRARADGRKRNILRCPECLTALWSEQLGPSDYATIYAGTLDSSPALQPEVHIWTDDAQPWIVLPQGVPRFPRNPPDMDALTRTLQSARKP